MSRRWWWALPPVLILAVLSPMILTQRTFDPDWFNHLWLVRMQRTNISVEGHPSLFLHAFSRSDIHDLGVFYPQYAFYGGTLYSSAGLLALVIGAPAAYIAFFALGLAMCLGGWTWLARQAGVSLPLAFVPGVVNVTAAYVMANAYGRGAWPEFVATLTLPLLAAAGWALLRAPRITVAPAAALVVATVYLTGSHNITLVWGVVFLGLVLLAGALALGPRGLRALQPRRLAAVGGLMALGVGVNAWFLLPDLAYAKRVGLDAYDDGAAFFNTASVVLDPVRSVPEASTSPGLTVQAPVVALAWALLAFLLARGWRQGARWWRLVLGLCALLAGFLVLVLRDDPTVGSLGRSAWEAMPQFLRYLQFAFRLQSYVTMLVCALVLVAVVAVARAPRGRLRSALLAAVALVCATSTYQAVHQAWRQPSYRDDRGALLAKPVREIPITWGDAGNFRDRSAPLVEPPAGRAIHLDPEAAAQRGEQLLAFPPGRAPVGTNIAAGTYLIQVEGVAPVGRRERGQMVVTRTDAGDGAVRVRIRPATTWPLRDGPVVTLGSLAALAALSVAGLRRERRRRRRR
jgi:hypothetical protein